MDKTIHGQAILATAQVNDILDQLTKLSPPLAYIYVHPEHNRDRHVLRPTRYYLSNIVIRALLIDAKRFQEEKLQIEFFHTTSKETRGLDLAFSDLECYYCELPIDIDADFRITPILQPNLAPDDYYRSTWRITNTELFTTSTCPISPMNVYLPEDTIAKISPNTQEHPINKDDVIYEKYPFLNPAHPQYNPKLELQLNGYMAIKINKTEGDGGYEKAFTRWVATQEHSLSNNKIKTLAYASSPLDQPRKIK